MGEKVTVKIIEQVMEGVRFVPEDLDKFSKFGCKMIGQILAEL